ncbi:hypothetical protein [Clostridium ganghwense]|uniref:Uncharacterized protein n=1 Tax=Clostridium ganghwense TaxID=312089 RepID=A0ABT4CMV9_9CLOT|nr:hypothetical protein [Clostridium ganghwense]MCY6370278.1 hypothetical protein [Clostridium ganghwense]
MYKEIVIRKKISSIFIIVLMLTVSIVVSDIIANLSLGEYEVGNHLTSLLSFFVFILIIRQIEMCKIKYKYSIIADEFIIYKVKGNKQQIMASVKVKDIECIEKIGKNKIYLDAVIRNMYGCLNFDNDLYFCKYNNGNGTKRFYFEPSHKLVEKLDVLKNKEVY